MPRGVQFRRRIKVTIGNQIVTDVDPAVSAEVNDARTLDTTFTTEAHVKAAPLITTLTVRGLNRQQRKQMTTEQDAAEKTAWELRQAVQSGATLVEDEQIFQFQQQLTLKGGIISIVAGYDGDSALLAKAQILPDGIEHEYDGESWLTTIRAQDTRYPWQNSFASEVIAPGVTLIDMQAALQLSEQFLIGEVDQATVAAKIPGLLETKNFGGYANGRVLHGDSRNFEQEIIDRLGLRRFFDRGQLRLIDAAATTLDEAVVLRLVPKHDRSNPTPGGLLKYKELKRGFVEIVALLNHRITAGRQVILQDDQGKPVGGGVFRVDYVQHAGSNFDVGYNSMATLRPVTVDLALNV